MSNRGTGVPHSTQPQLTEEKQISHTWEATQVRSMEPAWSTCKGCKGLSQAAAETFSSILWVHSTKMVEEMTAEERTPAFMF